MNRIKKNEIGLIGLFIVVLFSFFMAITTSNAAGASLTGGTNVRAGDSFTLSFNVAGSNIYYVQGTLSYDSSVVTFNGIEKSVGGSWVLEQNGNNVLLYDNSMSSPVTSGSVATLSFTVKSDASSGAGINISMENVSVSDGSKDTSYGTATWSTKVLAPKSSNNYLSSLTCSNGTLSPAFSESTTSYSITVPYDTTSLSLNYSVAGSGAYASVSGNNLSVGINTVTVTVTAENGSTRRYNISVTRQQNPDYKASTDATLSAINISDGKLSPAFDPTVKNYIVYIPFEVESFSVSGVANDSKALSVTEDSLELAEGDNILKITCTAEDGTTMTTYTVHAYRMPAFSGTIPIIGNDEIEDKIVEETEQPEETIEESNNYQLPRTFSLPLFGTVSSVIVGIVFLIIILLIALLVGMVIGRAAETQARKKLIAKNKEKLREIEYKAADNGSELNIAEDDNKEEIQKENDFQTVFESDESSEVIQSEPKDNIQDDSISVQTEEKDDMEIQNISEKHILNTDSLEDMSLEDFEKYLKNL